MTLRLTLLLLMISVTSSLVCAQNAATVESTNAKHALQAQDYEQFIPYWTTESSWHSELQVRNNLRAANLTVTPYVRSADGVELALAPIEIKPQEVQSLDLNATLQRIAPQFMGTFGSIALKYHSLGLQNLYAAVMAHDMGHPIAFHLDAINEVQNYDQVSREGIWWLPRDGVQDWLILTNQSSFPMDLTLSLSDAAGRISNQKIALEPRATGRYSVRPMLLAAGLRGSYGGVKIESAAHSGSLDTVHVLFDEKGGFSANLKMFDRDPKAQVAERDFARTSIWTLRAPMLALQHPDPALSFPSGTALQPKLFIRNTTDRIVNTALQFNWRSESATGKATGPALALQPYETRLIDVSALPASQSPPPEAHWAAIAMKTTGLPDEVMAVAASYDETLRYGAQTPFSDQMTYRWEGGKWEYDRDHDSIITAGNGGTKPIKASFAIYYEQGSKKYEVEQTLQPDDQMWIDIGEIIQQQIPDKSGNVLPLDLTSGSYQFNDLTDHAIGSLFEGKVMYDKTFGHVSYGCASCCGSLGTPWFSPSPLGVALSSTGDADVIDNDGCDGYQSSVLYGFSSWSSANTSIANISKASAVVSGMSIGSAVQSSPGSITIGGSDFKKCRIGQYTPSGPATITNGIPNYMAVVSDSYTAYLCPVGTSDTRQINYSVFDSLGSFISRAISVLETVDPSTQSTCTGKQISTSYTCTPIATGNFTDTFQPGCPSTQQLDNGCGYTFPSQEWQWCNPGGAYVNLGDVGTDIVHNNSISIGGNVNGYTPGKTFPH